MHLMSHALFAPPSNAARHVNADNIARFCLNVGFSGYILFISISKQKTAPRCNRTTFCYNDTSETK